jgi:hypothetical protein
MQKAFYDEDIMEFKINNKWSKGKLKDIIINQNKYIVSLEKGEDNYEIQNKTLLINSFNVDSIIKNIGSEYNQDQKVEYFDEVSNSWNLGTIKKKNKDFYIISYEAKPNVNNSKILYRNSLRPLTNDKDILKLNLNQVKVYSLKNFETLSNPMKYMKKFIKKLINLFADKIYFIFLNNNYDLFIFGAENENEKSLVNKVVINGLIDVAINHFKDFDKSNKKLFK